MAHFTIDYSPNLEGKLDFADFCNAIRIAAVETGVFPVAGIRVRATACNHVSIADGNPQHGFIDISIRLRAGRSDDAKKSATAHVFEAARTFLEPALSSNPIALSLEMRDIDPDLSPKTGTIRDYLESHS